MITDIAVLAVQGDFDRHLHAFAALGVAARPVRTSAELASVTHLVLPGGESTTMLKLLAEYRLDQAILDLHARGGSIFATCAGVILLAREVRSPAQASLGLLDAVVERNGYGRQLASFSTRLACPAISDDDGLDAVFIRAPVIHSIGPAVEVLAARDTPVLVRQGNILAATFHPELTADTRVHQYFLRMAANDTRALAG